MSAMIAQQVSFARREAARQHCLARIASFQAKYEPILVRLSEHEFRGLLMAVAEESKRREPTAADQLGREIARWEDERLRRAIEGQS